MLSQLRDGTITHGTHHLMSSKLGGATITHGTLSRVMVLVNPSQKCTFTGQIRPNTSNAFRASFELDFRRDSATVSRPKHILEKSARYTYRYGQWSVTVTQVPVLVTSKVCCRVIFDDSYIGKLMPARLEQLWDEGFEL